MKPKNLKFPFSWQERRPLLHDHVLYVPKHYNHNESLPIPDWKDPQLFGNDHDICVEFCSGNGLWIFEKALAYPHKNWIAVEKRFDRTRKIWAKIKNFSLKNLIVVCGEAESFIDHYVKEDVICEAYINFPDPWPKEKHAKHRIFKQPFLQRLSSVCKNGAKSTFVTDDENYSYQMIEQMNLTSKWRPTLLDPFYVEDWPEYGSSYFDELFRAKGKKIRYIQYVNTKR
jgi:tRNA (guanine-N7-)-methyltransferase